MPISAQLKYNIDAVNEYIVKRIPIPVRDFLSEKARVTIYDPQVSAEQIWLDLAEAIPDVPVETSACAPASRSPR